ncbi:Cysteine-rich receptor-like protein kinase 2 [Platanthera guangdongensis]|uniref:Cysteine-rich receptor-like protein kinase 2 n=1 Tax=Platanthera guangdongensis TaxID=2320717 RepID=A0ABR2M1M5_9ASPA
MSRRFVISIIVLLFLWDHFPAIADPQTNFLNLGCSTYNATNKSLFFANLNSTFSDLHSEISAGINSTVTTEETHSSAPVYALFFCRTYLSQADCLGCLAAAVDKVRSCGAGTGGRVIFDGCTLRYESAPFFDQGTLPGNTAVCGNGTTALPGFPAGVSSLTGDLSLAAPSIVGYSAAAEEGGVYGAAQCAATLSKEVCAQCLQVAYTNIQQCLPAGNGRSVDAGCFMRFSNVGFSLRGPVNFRYRDLKSATKNFSQENKLGEGGFGDVYKGTLKNKKVVAVKRLAVSQTESAKASFQSEVKLISNVHHRNLVRLLGCCSKSHDLLLVYEYMGRGSLDRFLFGSEKKELLSWKQRFDIIVGMAKGISYLHHEFHVCIIHRDIKPSNILLDDNFQPKIADFGLVKLLPGDQSHVSTKFAGTLGYTAPEYALHGQLTEKVDTYSFGVVILEIISGRRNSDPKLGPSNQYLLVWQLYEDGDLVELIDKSMDPDEYDFEEVKRVIKVALLCIQSMVSLRPTMSETVILLLTQAEPKLDPMRPIFIDSANGVRGETSSAYTSTTQATMSITQFSAR